MFEIFKSLFFYVLIRITSRYNVLIHINTYQYISIHINVFKYALKRSKTLKNAQTPHFSISLSNKYLL